MHAVCLGWIVCRKACKCLAHQQNAKLLSLRVYPRALRLGTVVFAVDIVKACFSGLYVLATVLTGTIRPVA